MNGNAGPDGILMKNIMRLVVAGSIFAITVNMLMLFG
jgi:hypothetical protein